MAVCMRIQENKQKKKFLALMKSNEIERIKFVQKSASFEVVKGGSWGLESSWTQEFRSYYLS